MSPGVQVRLIRSGLGLATAVLLALPVAAPLFAQQTVIEAQVEQIAGSDIYLNAGTDRGVGPGAVLVVLGADGEDEAGRLRVIESTSSRSVTTFVGTPFPITRGATLRLRLEAVEEGAEAAAVAAGAAAGAAAGGAVTPRPTARSSASSSRSTRIKRR